MFDSSARGPRTALIAVGVVLALGVGFAVGRSTTDDTAHAASWESERTDSKSAAPASATTTTLPPLNVDELAEKKPDQPLDAPTRAKLAADLEVARSVALQYPTVASASAAHMLQAGNFAPQLGAHYISYANVGREIRPDGSVDARYPGGFIYDGNSPSSRLVGLMYISLGSTLPSGFPGPNDHWHRHHNLCIKYGPTGITVPFAPDRDITREECDGVHGSFMKQTVWMVHAWVVPGWESPKGVFSHEDPDLTCADGTVHTDAVGFCKGT